MLSMDREVLAAARDWLQAGEAPWFCTIVETIGSSPRPVGSLLTCLDTGEQVGSVSGGCVEEDLLERMRAGQYTGERPEVVAFGVTAEENERLGLPCGGRLTLLLQRLGPADVDWICAVTDALAQRQVVRRQLDLAAGTTRVDLPTTFGTLQFDGAELSQCFGPRLRMLLVGAGQLACNLAELALAMDYEVFVTDPRQETLAQWSGPDLPLIQGMPDDVVREQASDAHSLVITLTHDPRIDDMALMEALTTDALYVGALGSVRTSAKRMERLRQLELSEAQLARLHAPVGLDIGSKTPIEIAVAIMAELTALRRRNSVVVATGAAAG